jgi:hypothetical protein
VDCNCAWIAPATDRLDRCRANVPRSRGTHSKGSGSSSTTLRRLVKLTISRPSGGRTPHTHALKCEDNSPSSTVHSCPCQWFQPDAVLGGDQAELPRVRARPIEAVTVPHRGVVERAVAHRAMRAVRACPRGVTATARDAQQMGFDGHGAHRTSGWCRSALVGPPRSTPNWFPTKRTTTTQAPSGYRAASSPVNQARRSRGGLRELGRVAAVCRRRLVQGTL